MGCMCVHMIYHYDLVVSHVGSWQQLVKESGLTQKHLLDKLLKELNVKACQDKGVCQLSVVVIQALAVFGRAQTVMLAYRGTVPRVDICRLVF